jgi:hypothetical protein
VRCGRRPTSAPTDHADIDIDIGSDFDIAAGRLGRRSCRPRRI